MRKRRRNIWSRWIEEGWERGMEWKKMSNVDVLSRKKRFLRRVIFLLENGLFF